MDHPASSLASTRTGNIPAELTPFVGRRREMAEVLRDLKVARLVTLYGTGGIGKTRLAIRVATEVRQHFADGAWLVELSAVSAPLQVARAVVAVLEIPDRSGADPVDLLADYVADKRMLLVIDTCEHVADACAMLAEVLLQAAPGLQIIATSRRPLTITGEHTYEVRPLPLPDAEAGGEAIELFVDRARAALPGFEVTPDNERDVITICRRLDGIPLAIELAAMRLRVMTLPQIAQRLDQRFRLLGGVRIGRGRHETLLTTVQWSHDLCDEVERLLWARIAIFPGTFDLASAEAVCGGGTLPDDEVLDALTGLVEKSIVLYDQRSGRYRMLDTIAEFGRRLLDGVGEQEELRRRHRDAYQAFVERAIRRWCGGGQIGLFHDLRQEMPNLVAAFDYSLSTPGEEATGLSMIADLSFFWFEGLELGTGREWLEEALRRVPQPCLERGWGLRALANVAMMRGDYDRALAYLDEAMPIAENEPGSTLLGHLQHVRGTTLAVGGRLDEALAPYWKAIEIFDERGYDDPHAVCTLVVLAATHTLRGRPDEALPLLERCLPICAERQDLWSEGFALWMRGLTYLTTGKPAAAILDVRRSLELKEAIGDVYQVALALDLYAFCLTDLGEAGTATVILGSADALWTRMAAEKGPSWSGLHARYVDKMITTLGEQAVAIGRAKGATQSPAEALAMLRGERSVQIEAPAAPNPLTKRELEVARLVTQGLSNRQIGEQLFIAKRTVDSHVDHILGKLRFISRAQIAAWITTTDDASPPA